MNIRPEDSLFWDLIEQERHRMWRLARALTRSYDDALDLMSDTVLAAYKSFPALRDRSRFRWFVSTIAVRLQRRKRWRARIFVPIDEASHVTYESNRESTYDLDVLVGALNRLPTREREALVLFEIGGHSLKEIQQIQGGSLSGVKSRMSRSRDRLKNMIVEPLDTVNDRNPLTRLAPPVIRFQGQ